jgi:hypothetical protein
MRDLETIDAELRLVAALRRTARERGGPLPSIYVADAPRTLAPRIIPLLLPLRYGIQHRIERAPHSASALSANRRAGRPVAPRGTSPSTCTDPPPEPPPGPEAPTRPESACLVKEFAPVFQVLLLPPMEAPHAPAPLECLHGFPPMLRPVAPPRDQGGEAGGSQATGRIQHRAAWSARALPVPPRFTPR